MRSYSTEPGQCSISGSPALECSRRLWFLCLSSFKPGRLPARGQIPQVAPLSCSRLTGDKSRFWCLSWKHWSEESSLNRQKIMHYFERLNSFIRFIKLRRLPESSILNSRHLVSRSASSSSSVWNSLVHDFFLSSNPLTPSMFIFS